MQLLNHVQLSETPWTAARQASLSITSSQSLLKLNIRQVDVAIQTSHPLSSLLLLPSVFPSIRVFSNESVLCVRWPNSWSFSFSISPSRECSGLIFWKSRKMMEAVYFIVHCACWLLWYSFPVWLNWVLSPQMECSLRSVTCFYLSKKTDTLGLAVCNTFIMVVRLKATPLC